MYIIILVCLCVLLVLTIIVILYRTSESYNAVTCTDFDSCNRACKGSDSWEGWATTTVFGKGETCWPSSVKNAINLHCIDSEKNAMGAAIPWRILCKTYGSRQNMLDQLSTILYDGQTDTKNQCFEIQPISVPPSDVIQGSFDRKGFGTKFDINDPKIAAKDSSGKEYPKYILYPFEGCGGNCKTCPDCFNNCYGVLTTPDEINKVLGCDFSTITKDCCNNMKTLWKNNWSPDNKDEFLTNNYSLAINDSGDFDESGQTVNWCSGFNYHFDLAVESPLWSTITPSDANGPYCKSKGDYNNIVVRYRKINCPTLSNCKRC